MFTVCPKCALTLVVTAADLRVAQGYVRCGRCSNVFNAIVSLSEDRKPPEPESAASASATATATTSIIRKAPSLPQDTAPDDPLSETSESEVLYAEPDPQELGLQQPASTEPASQSGLEFSLSEAELTKVFVQPGRGEQDESTGTFETIILRSEDERAEELTAEPDKEAPHDPEADEIDSELRALAAQLDAKSTAKQSDKQGAEDGRAATRELPEPSARTGPEASPAASAAEAVAESLAPPASRRLRTGIWASGIGVLCLTLAAQVIHHNRHDLATNPRLNRPLTRFYAAIGVPLVPRWNLHSYEIRQLGASTGGASGGELIVRASLQNDAKQPLPLPLLRVTVQDRYGNRIASRDVPPQAYVPGAVPEDAHLGAGQRIDTEMRFQDPGREAVGFEIDACLPQPGGRIACANDLAGR